MIVLRIGYLIVFLIWTWLLVKPQPVPESLVGGVSWFDPELLFFVLAKATHFSVYAGLAIIGGWLVRDHRNRMVLWCLLIVHGIGSEVGQMIGDMYFETKRHGCIRDMLIDAVGVTFGALAIRWYFSHKNSVRTLPNQN